MRGRFCFCHPFGSVTEPKMMNSGSLATQKIPFWAQIQTVWLLLPALCTAIFVLCQPLAPNDLWYHVRAGEMISRWGAVPRENLMSWAVPLDTPYHYQSWLSEWLLFQTLQHFGLSGLQILRTFLFASGVLCLSLAAWRGALGVSRQIFQTELSAAQTLSMARFLAAIGVLALLIFSNNVDLRPQSFSFWLFCLWIYVLSQIEGCAQRSLRWFWGAFLLLITTVWANTHGAFVLALVGLTCFCLGYGFQRNQSGRFYAVLLLLSLFFVCVNPRGPEIYSYLLNLSTDQISQKYIEEWQSPNFTDGRNILFFLLPFFSFFLIWQIHRSRSPIEGSAGLCRVWPWLLFFLATCVMGLRDMRSVIWCALLCVPLLSSFWVLRVRSTPDTRAPTTLSPALRAMNGLTLALFLLLPVPLLPQFKTQIPWPAEFRARFAPTPPRLFPNQPALLLDRLTPVEIIEFWMQSPRNQPKSRVFTNMLAGSYMTWATHPQILPSSDPRIELFPPDFWEEYVRLSNGARNANQILKKWRCDQALLDLNTQKPLQTVLEDAGWKPIAQAGKSLLLLAPSDEKFE